MTFNRRGIFGLGVAVLMMIISSTNVLSAAPNNPAEDEKQQVRTKIQGELAQIAAGLVPYINSTIYPSPKSTEELSIEVEFNYEGFENPIIHTLKRNNPDASWTYSGLEVPFNSILLKLDELLREAEIVGLVKEREVNIVKAGLWNASVAIISGKYRPVSDLVDTQNEFTRMIKKK